MDEEGRLCPVHSAEVYLPWNNTWLELPPLPLINDQDQDMGELYNSRIFSLNKEGLLNLYLLGGISGINTEDDNVYTNDVWRLIWDSSNQSYHWTEDKKPSPAMGELYH